MRILDFADGFESSTEPTIVGLDADEVTVAPSGNLESTDVQAALEELQGDIDTINGSLGEPDGIATLDSNGKVPIDQMSATVIIDVYSVADITARDALTVQEGDVAVVDDDGSGAAQSYIYNGTSWVVLIADASLLAHANSTTGIHGVTGNLVGTSDSQTLTNKTIVAANNTVTTASSGNLAATELNAALAELQSDIDTRALDADLDAHTGDTSDAHDASAISVTPAGNLLATDVQSALEELDSDLDDHITNPTDAHDASAVSYDNGTSGLTADEVQSAIDEVAGLVGGGGSLPVTTKTTTYSITALDAIILCDTSSAGFTVTLPTAVGNTGKEFHIYKISSDANILTVDTTSSQTMNGFLTWTLAGQYSRFILFSDGSNWIVRQAPNRIQTKLLTGDISSAQTMADLTFSNLIVGKKYKVYLQAWIGSLGTTSASAFVSISHNGATIGRATHAMGGASTQNEDNEHSTVVTFIAAATTLTFVFAESGTAICYGNNTQTETFAQLEELNNNLEQVSAF